MSELTANVQEREGVSIIQLSGYLSSGSETALEEAFQQANEAAKVLIAFREKDMISSAGIALLFDLILTAQGEGKQVRIAQPTPHFRKVFDIVGLSKDVEIFESEAQAVAGW